MLATALPRFGVYHSQTWKPSDTCSDAQSLCRMITETVETINSPALARHVTATTARSPMPHTDQNLPLLLVLPSARCSICR